jgi:hypothetical protein
LKESAFSGTSFSAIYYSILPFAANRVLDMLEPLKYSNHMNRLNKEKRTQIIFALVEGNSLRATARMCDVAFNTVLKFLPEIGKACAEYQDKALRNLSCKRIQCDEIWSFCYAKEKNIPEENERRGWNR